MSILGFNIYDILGMTGVFCGLYSYARLQWHRNYARHINYSILNLAASVLLIISLMHDWNFSSFVLNAVWGIISAYGVYRCLKYIRKGQPTEP